MFEKLRQITKQYEELLGRLEQPETYGDPALYAKTEKQARQLAPLAEAYAAWERTCGEEKQAEDMLADPEMKELAQEELAAARAARGELEQKLRILLLPKDPNDEKNVILEIRGGVGGEEGMLFAADLFRM